MQSLINYFRDTKAELRHVQWPSARQAAVYTALIIAVCLAVSLILGFFDFLFTKVLDWFIGV
jgi:preprotein translocase SecE subunit